MGIRQLLGECEEKDGGCGGLHPADMGRSGLRPYKE
jgi:hypothetical protein